MKRREFIINSALAIGGTALLTGCGEKKNYFIRKNRLQNANIKI